MVLNPSPPSNFLHARTSRRPIIPLVALVFVAAAVVAAEVTRRDPDCASITIPPPPAWAAERRLYDLFFRDFVDDPGATVAAAVLNAQVGLKMSPVRLVLAGWI